MNPRIQQPKDPGIQGSKDPRIQKSAFHKVPDISAEGAGYDSQGQAPNNERRVAPGHVKIICGEH